MSFFDDNETRKQIIIDAARTMKQYNHDRNSDVLREVVALYEELTGLNFELGMRKSGQSVLLGQLGSARNQLGRSILGGTEFADPVKRLSLSQDVCDLMDLSIPTINPWLTGLHCKRIRERFNLDDKTAIGVIGFNTFQPIELHSIDQGLAVFHLPGGDEYYDVGTDKIELRSGEQRLLLSKAYAQMRERERSMDLFG